MLFIFLPEVVLSALHLMKFRVDLQIFLAMMAAVPAAFGHLCLHKVSIRKTSQESRSLSPGLSALFYRDQLKTSSVSCFKRILWKVKNVLGNKRTQTFNTLPKALLVYKPMQPLLLYQITNTKTKFSNPKSLLHLWGRHRNKM